jgi:RNA polymerase sigma-70 factor (ECF subfamily)
VDDLTRLALDARDGDAEALARFVAESQAEVWRLAAHLVDRGAADDLTQEVYERALGGLSRFRGDSSARTWLLSIARRTCVDAIRRRGRMRVREDRLRALAVDRATGLADHAVELDELLAALDPDRRAAFVLTQLLGYGYAEAAEVCRCPRRPGGRLARARRRHGHPGRRGGRRLSGAVRCGQPWRTARSSSWKGPLVARPLPPPGVSAPERSVKRPPASWRITGMGARS